MPLATHCFVHGILTLGIILAYNPALWWLSIVDFVTHFIMDRLKSGPRYMGRWNDKDQPGFWNALGFDQMIHHLTGFYIVWTMIKQ